MTLYIKYRHIQPTHIRILFGNGFPVARDWRTKIYIYKFIKKKPNFSFWASVQVFPMPAIDMDIISDMLALKAIESKLFAYLLSKKHQQQRKNAKRWIGWIEKLWHATHGLKMMMNWNAWVYRINRRYSRRAWTKAAKIMYTNAILNRWFTTTCVVCLRAALLPTIFKTHYYNKNKSKFSLLILSASIWKFISFENECFFLNINWVRISVRAASAYGGRNVEVHAKYCY